MTKIISSSLTRALFFFYLSLAIALNFIVPPFQNPDEPQHFGATLTYASPDKDEIEIQRDILKVMDKNRWWRYVGMGESQTIPETFSEMSYLTFEEFRTSFGNIVFYHYILGRILKLLHLEDVLASYYLCRAISILLLLGALFFMYRAVRSLALAKESFLVYIVLFVALLPQFGLVSVSVNPDVLSIFLGSLFFFAGFSLIAKGFHLGLSLLAVAAAGAGFLTDKSSFLLIPLALLIPFFLTKRKRAKSYLLPAVSLFLLLLILISWMAWYFPSPVYGSFYLLRVSILNKASLIPQLLSFDSFSRNFLTFLADSFFFKFGWMAFSAAGIYYFIWRISLLLALAGIVSYLGRFIFLKIKRRANSSGSIQTRLALFSLLAAGFQVVGLWLSQGTRLELPQGRYLFPLIFPILFIFVLGLKTLFDCFHKQGGRIALSLFLLFEFIFFNLALWNYLIPVFHLMVKAPHAGL